MKICICSNDANTMQILWHSLIAYSCTVNMEFELIRENTQNLIAHESFPFDILFIDAASHASLDGIKECDKRCSVSKKVVYAYTCDSNRCYDELLGAEQYILGHFNVTP